MMNDRAKAAMMEDFRNLRNEDFLKEYAHMAICDDSGKILLKGRHHKDASPDLFKVSREDGIRDKFRQMFLHDPFVGTIKERLLYGYLYCISHDDLSLSPNELMKEKMAMKSIGQDRREVFVQTGKAGILTYVEAGKKMGHSEEIISKSIWLQMRVAGVELYINIKNLKVEN